MLGGFRGRPEWVEICEWGITDPQQFARVNGVEFTRSLRGAVDRCDGGHEFRLVGAHAVAGFPSVMVSGGCDPLVPRLVVWGKRFRWELDEPTARSLVAAIGQAMRRADSMDLGVQVPCVNVQV